MTQEAPRLSLTLDEITKVRFIELAPTSQGESATTPVGRALQKHAARPRGAFAGATGDAVRHTAVGRQYLEAMLNDPIEYRYLCNPQRMREGDQSATHGW